MGESACEAGVCGDCRDTTIEGLCAERQELHARVLELEDSAEEARIQRQRARIAEEYLDRALKTMLADGHSSGLVEEIAGLLGVSDSVGVTKGENHDRDREDSARPSSTSGVGVPAALRMVEPAKAVHVDAVGAGVRGGDRPLSPLDDPQAEDHVMPAARTLNAKIESTPEAQRAVADGVRAVMQRPSEARPGVWGRMAHGELCPYRNGGDHCACALSHSDRNTPIEQRPNEACARCGKTDRQCWWCSWREAVASSPRDPGPDYPRNEDDFERVRAWLRPQMLDAARFRAQLDELVAMFAEARADERRLCAETAVPDDEDLRAVLGAEPEESTLSAARRVTRLLEETHAEVVGSQAVGYHQAVEECLKIVRLHRPFHSGRGEPNKTLASKLDYIIREIGALVTGGETKP